MEMLQSLGINATAIGQFVIFIFTFVFLKSYVFANFHKAHLGRQERTKGGEALAGDYSKKTADLHAQYQDEARKTHLEISKIYQKNRSEATAEYEKIIGQARGESQKMIESSRSAIAEAVSSAENSLKGQASNVALTITNKLLGK